MRCSIWALNIEILCRFSLASVISIPIYTDKKPNVIVVREKYLDLIEYLLDLVILVIWAYNL